jgi:hypothetical protein
MIHQNVFVQRIGADNICTNIQHALNRAKQIMQETHPVELLATQKAESLVTTELVESQP